MADCGAGFMEHICGDLWSIFVELYGAYLWSFMEHICVRQDGRDLTAHGEALKARWSVYSLHYIILNNGILKSNSAIFPRSEGYISQYTP